MTAPLAPLVRLTDEELLLMNAAHPAVATPYLDGLDAGEQRTAVDVAFRALRAHGLQTSTDGAGLVLPEEVVSMLQVRESATTIVFVSKVTRGGQIVRYHHLGTDTMVVEDVDEQGVHDFSVLRADDLTASLNAWLASEGAVDGQGGTIAVGVAAAAGDLADAQDPWGEVVAQIDATVWRSSRETSCPPGELIGFVLGTRGSWMSRTRVGRSVPVQLEPVRVTQVAEHIAHLLDA
ncbi:hypothetical protein [Rudaeicoccus suwonensis]|uniref:ESAT-6 protein secretion system EspG family protein n=1 Tax=Rudaeicoccus suwonensis TaxID=657409 RepID=A0A561E9F2_9MICO|nr:hypothetical protein [Rudaeicoccus suwonensis]TWE12245.1 hypothetical protein BKA23_1045 [Rudaeicoccus suwonensis]